MFFNDLMTILSQFEIHKMLPTEHFVDFWLVKWRHFTLFSGLHYELVGVPYYFLTFRTIKITHQIL